MNISSLIKKIDYSDVIFYFLCASLFVVFLMPFYTFVSIHLKPLNSSGTMFANNIDEANKGMFINRYIILYYTTAIASLMVILNKNILSEIINIFSSFNIINKVAISLFFVFGSISASFAYSSSIAFKCIGLTFLMFFLALFIANYIKSKPEKIKHLYIVVLLSLIFYGVMLLQQLALSNFSIYGSYVAGNIQKVLLFTYNTLNPRFLDNYFSWFIPLLLLPWVMNYRPIFKIGSFLALTILWFIMINHAWRTIYLELIIIAVFLAFYDRKLLALVAKIIITSLICGIILNYLYIDFVMVPQNQQVIDTIARTTDSGRSLLWAEAFRLGLEHPLTGIGQWHYLVFTKRPDGYPHNLLLEIWSMWGIPAFLCFMTVVLSSVIYGFKNIKNILSSKPYGIIVLMLIAGMIDSMLSAMFKTSLGMFGSIFVFGLCLSYYTPNISIQKTPIIARSIITLAVLISCFCLTIAPMIWAPLWI